ncbi:MAG: type II secretion system protein [Candidatus Dactylopiibacterium sp.]|nr:type II secretion system protein [Candidatus Dactylopiibacterium sp.]
MRRIRPEPARRHRTAGFTLIEMVVVMTITGLLVAIVAVFIQRPMENILDSTRRVAMADAADGALRRMAREVRQALPNSLRVRQSGGAWFIEFLPVVHAGRYCEQGDCGAAPFADGASMSSLTVAGFAPPAWSQIPSGAELAIYNLGASGTNAWNGDNTTVLTGITGSTLTFAAKVFPYASPARRFQIIGRPVSFVCTPGGTLTRVSGYARAAGQPVTFPANANVAVLADNVAACSVDFQQATMDQTGLLALTLTLARNGERLTLSHAIQVSNTP